jgi:hypothetical protein
MLICESSTVTFVAAVPAIIIVPVWVWLPRLMATRAQPVEFAFTQFETERCHMEKYVNELFERYQEFFRKRL